MSECELACPPSGHVTTPINNHHYFVAENTPLVLNLRGGWGDYPGQEMVSLSNKNENYNKIFQFYCEKYTYHFLTIAECSLGRRAVLVFKDPVHSPAQLSCTKQSYRHSNQNSPPHEAVGLVSTVKQHSHVGKKKLFRNQPNLQLNIMRTLH